MTGKPKKPLTQPEPGDPNHGKASYQPGSLHTTDLPMQPSLKEQMQQSDPDPVPPFDRKACILCDHVIVQQVLGNKCKLSGALCCYMRSCPVEDRKKREAARPVLPDKTCDPSCPDRSPVCEETCPEYQFKERFASWLAVNYPALDITSHQDIVDNASGLFDEFWADRS